MSSLTLIVGTLKECMGDLSLLDNLYYEFIDEYPNQTDRQISIFKPVPILAFGQEHFNISQFLGSGKTLVAVNILAQKHYFGGQTAANLGLAWHQINEGKIKDDWQATINSFDNFKELKHCTALLDDLKGTISKWNTEEAELIAEVVNAGRKEGLDLVFTAQREKMIPPEIRDVATEWIVPVITVRDMTKETPDNMGYPLELIELHFDAEKTLMYISEPLVNLEPLFDAYSTLQRAISLQQGGEEGIGNTTRPGYNLEAEAFGYLKEKVPGMNWQLLNGKHVFDIISDTHAVDVVGTDPDGCLILEHKDVLRHIKTAKKLDQIPYFMFKHGSLWKLLHITYQLREKIEGKRLRIGLTKPRLFETVF